MEALGDRMKAYEACFDPHLPRRMPLVIRVDGRAFHTLTRSMDRPFDSNFCRCMFEAAEEVSREMQGFVLGYVQSDEASFFLQDYAAISTEPWFAKSLAKVVSLSAAEMSARFSMLLGRVATFDARAFVLPEAEVANYFLWRARDWARNSLNMYAQSFFSAKQLHCKAAPEVHDMLHGIGKNWATDLTDDLRNGTFLLPDGFRCDVLPLYAEVSSLVRSALDASLAELPLTPAPPRL